MAPLFPRLYGAAWTKVRFTRHYRPLEDELLWHKVYEQYINSLPPVELGAHELIEQHLGILRPIAGKIAWKRCPKSCGIWVKEAALSHVGLVHELAAFGVFGLFIAADRYKPDSGWAFSTYANFWIKKFIALYLDEIVGIVPRTGHMGPDPSTFCINEDGELCWVDFPRRSVMDLVDAALARQKVFRGKASGGMPIFDCGLTIPGPNPGDKEIEIVGSDGPTDPTRLDYLQRHVSQKLYPWIDVGAYQPNGKPWPLSVRPERLRQLDLIRKEFGIRQPISTPRRFELPGHPGGKASAEPPREDTYELDDSIELPAKPVPIEHTGPATVFTAPAAEVCYLKKHSPYYYNSWATFVPQRRKRKKRWRKPSIREDVWCALAA